MPPAHVSSSVPLTQNTALILEFRCLFTPDLKKKQKKWQDGRLKFHTFNKRIMVYDDRTNYVGDTHYHTTTLEEGEELELERGVLVEVGELLAKQDQDLGEILQSVQGAAKSARQASIAPERGAGRGATPGPTAGRYTTPAPAPRQMSIISSGSVRPLCALLDTPSGHHGRALMPITSPFEDRENRLASETPEPASKRRKVDNAPGAQPLWARTSLMQSGTRGEISLPTARPMARELSYPDSIAPKARVNKTFDKLAKPGYAQKLTGAVLDLSGSQKKNAYNSRQSINIDTSDEENGDDVSAMGVRERAIAAPILPPVKRKPGPILLPKKPAQVVYPDSIVPKAKPRRTFEKASKAGYADKLTGASLNLSSSNMTHVTKRLPLNRQTSVDNHEIEDDADTAAVQGRPRVERPILPHPPQRRPAPILLPSAPRDIVYPESIAPKSKSRKTFEKKSKAGYAEKLTGAALNLSGAPSVLLKKSQPTQEEEDLLARLAELRAQREAVEAVEEEELEGQAPAPKPKKALTRKAKAPPADIGHTSGKENEESLFGNDDFVDIDAVVPRPPAKATKGKKHRTPRKKNQTDVSPADVGVDDTATGNGSMEEGETGRIKSNSKSLERAVPIRNASQGTSSEDDTRKSSETPTIAVNMTSQTLLSASTGSLRIKSKPKRTMLMMQSISPQLATSLAAAPAPKPAILPGASLLAKNQPPPEPSQATKTLIKFHNKQKEKLEERKRKIEARKRVPIEIHSSPEIEPQDDHAMDIPSSPIDLDEEEWVNPNATKSTGNPENAAQEDGEEAPVQPTPDVTQQQPTATPSSKSKPFSIKETGDSAQGETEESFISYTDIDNLLRPQRLSPLFCRTATALSGLDPSAQGESITPPPQPSLPQSSAFTQAKERVKRPLPDFSASTKTSLDVAKSSLRRPPVPLFSSTEDDMPQSSLFVRDDSLETNDTHISNAPLKGQGSVVQVLSSDDYDPSQPIRAAERIRAAAIQQSRQNSPNWPSDDESGSETKAPSPPSRAIKARPIVDSSDSMAWPESQAEEGGFSSSPPPGPRHRELSAADEERLANGRSILVKIKSGIRSKEIIRPNSINLIRNGDGNPFIGFVRPPQPIVRSRTGSFIVTEAEEGSESEDGIDEDEIMVDLEAQAEEERQIARRREEAQRRTREFREKKEIERVAKEQETERLRLEAEDRAEAERKKRDEKMRLQDEQTKAQQLLERQGRERVIEAEKKLAEEKKLETQRREAEEERQREEKQRLEEQARLDAEKARQENLRLEAEAENRRRESETKRKADEEAGKLNAEKLKSAQLAKETWEAQEETRRQKEKDALDAQKKLDKQAKYEQMKLKLQAEIEAQMQEKYRAMEEELRVKLDAQNERDRLEKERQEKAEIQRQEDLRIKELNEARQRQLDAKKLEDQRIADLRMREKRDAEQRKRKEVADQARQQRAVEAAVAKLTNSASFLPRSLPHALQGFQADESEAEKGKMSRQCDYQKRVNTSLLSVNGNTAIELIDISEGEGFGEGDLILAQPKATAFKPPAARSQAAMQPQAPRPPAAMTPNRSFQGFPTHIHAAMYANGITTASHDFAPTFLSTPPAVGYKVPSTLHLSAPTFKPFCKPKSVPIVPKNAPKTMKEIRDEKIAERETKEDLKILPGFEEKGEILSWETGAWTKEAGDLFGWRPKSGDGDDDRV